jgi:hypothetical protein
MLGKIVFIRPFVRKGKLLVRTLVQFHERSVIEALLPERELAALVPRSLLLFTAKEAPVAMLEIIGSILRRMTLGRIVRLHRHGDEWRVTFLSWSPVRFGKRLPEKKTTSA